MHTLWASLVTISLVLAASSSAAALGDLVSETTEVVQQTTSDTLTTTTEAADAVAETVDDSTSTVEDTTTTVEDTTPVEDTTTTVEDTTTTVEDTTTTVEDTTPVQDTTTTIEDTASTIADTVDTTTHGLVDTVSETGNNASSMIEGESIVEDTTGANESSIADITDIVETTTSAVGGDAVSTLEATTIDASTTITTAVTDPLVALEPTQSMVAETLTAIDGQTIDAGLVTSLDLERLLADAQLGVLDEAGVALLLQIHGAAGLTSLLNTTLGDLVTTLDQGLLEGYLSLPLAQLVPFVEEHYQPVDEGASSTTEDAPAEPAVHPAQTADTPSAARQAAGLVREYPLETVGGLAAVSAVGAAAVWPAPVRTVARKTLGWLAKALALIPFIGGFTRLNSETIRSHPMRAKALAYIDANPGASIQDVQEALGAAWGTAVYHLECLEKSEEVVSERQGRSRRYYIRGTKIASQRAAAGLVLETTPRRLLETIIVAPGATQSDLCDHLDLKHPTASKHLGRMVEEGLVEKHVDGRSRRYTATARAEEVLAA